MEEYKSNIGTMMEEQEKVPGFKDLAQRLGQEMANIQDKDAINQIKQDWKDIQDGAKKEYLESHKTEILDSDLTMFPKPRKSCKHCYGRGFEGAKIISGAGKDIALCRCIKNRIGRADLSEDKFMTYGEFQSILAHCNELFGLGENYETLTKDVQRTTEEDTNTRDEVESGRISESSKPEVRPT